MLLMRWLSRLRWLYKLKYLFQLVLDLLVCVGLLLWGSLDAEGRLTKYLVRLLDNFFHEYTLCPGSGVANG